MREAVQLSSNLPLHLAVSYDLGEDLIPCFQTCSPEFVVVNIDEEKIVTGADCA